MIEARNEVVKRGENMGLFDFLKKKEPQTKSSACLGVLDMFALANDRVLLIAELKGSLMVGDCLQVCHPDESMSSLGELEVLQLSDGEKDVPSLSDASLAHIVIAQSDVSKLLKKGSILYTEDISNEERLSQYTNALFRTFVLKQGGEMTDEDRSRASLDDSIEILRLFLWHCHEHRAEETKEDYQENVRKINLLKGLVRDKLLAADAIYVYYSQLTEEPYLFSQTIDRGEEGYLCTDPLIYIFTRRWYQNFQKEIESQADVEVREIKNTADGQGILNFLGPTFYMNGALGAMLNTNDVSIEAPVLVAKPDFSSLPKVEIPAMNPDVVRWMLLMGQLGEVETEGEKQDYGLYYGFFYRELPKARLLVPMKKGEGFPESKEGEKQLVLQEGASFSFPTRKGKGERPALQVFTDWKRLRMVFDEEWSALIESEGSMLSTFDYILNWTGQAKGACYVSQDTFEEMKKQFEQGS